MTFKRLISTCLVFTFLIGSASVPYVMPRALVSTIYADALGTGWENWSWATVNLDTPSPVHSGIRSIAVSFGGWQGLYLHKSGVDTSGLTHLRFYLHGGSTGGQQMNVFMNLQVGGIDQNGPAVAVIPPAANSWSEVRVPISTLNPASAVITGITWQAASGSTQPVVFFDDIALVSDESPDGPQIASGSLHPRSIPADGSTTLVVRAAVTDPQGAADLSEVSLDASGLGGGVVALRDDGRNNDGLPNDGVYGTVLTVAPGTPSGERRLLVSARDQAGNTSGFRLGALTVLAAPGGEIPAVLPQRIGWGSNAWSETPGNDWQVNSGVSWDYVYQYITWDWETWGGSFVSRFVNQAWDKGYVPIVTVYMILGVPPGGCGEGGVCYAQKLQNASTVQAYLGSLKRAVQEADGSQPVIFNLEPDFYGFMQQLSNDAGQRPAGVIANDPASYPVALNISGYPNNLAGFGRYMVDMIHSTAANALVAPMASMWATNGDPQSVTEAAAIEMGVSTAAFIDAMGGSQADLLVVEWSDRDAGRGIRPWWDDKDYDLPRPTRALLWENALSKAAQKRLLLWQMPVGNMSLDNASDNHYQDNRAAYAFAHPRDLVDAGVFGVVFGGGDGISTQVWSDNGFVAAQGAIAYAPPMAPAGLTAGSVIGQNVQLRWMESADVDLWGYRVAYRLLPSGNLHVLNTGRRNAISLFLPTAGNWEVRLRSYDAMGIESLLTAPVTVLVLTNAKQIFLPVIRR